MALYGLFDIERGRRRTNIHIDNVHIMYVYVFYTVVRMIVCNYNRTSLKKFLKLYIRFYNLYSINIVLINYFEISIKYRLSIFLDIFTKKLQNTVSILDVCYDFKR